MEKFSLRAQLTSCLAMALIAFAIIHFVQKAPLPAVLATGLPLGMQAVLGVAVGALLGGGSALWSYRRPDSDTVRRTAASYARLDLSGLNPLWISLGAGISEELLFRAALQPLLGIWLSSLLFLAVHAGAYEFRKIDRTTLLQAGSVLGMSLGFGLLYDYAGLLCVMAAHATIDVFGLYSVRYQSEKRLR